MKSVFLLWHTHVQPTGDEDGKLIGVYASRSDADRAQERAAILPGFRVHPDGFEIAEYIVGQDHWAEGFVTED